MKETGPLIKQGWLRVFLFFIGFFVFQLIGGAVVALLLSISGNADIALDKIAAADSAFSIAILVSFNFITAFLLVFFFRKFIDRKTIYSLGWNLSDNKIHALAGFFTGTACVGISTLSLAAMGNLSFTGWLVDIPDLFFSLGVMVLVAVAEEFMFRGYILANLVESVNKYAALFISAVLFMLAHATNPGVSWLALVNIFLAGLILGVNYIYTGNLWYAIFFHFMWNYLQGPILGYKVSGLSFQSLIQQEMNGSELVTGGSFGLEGSIIATVFLILFTILLAIVYERKSKTAASVPHAK